MNVRKRDGTTQPYDSRKLERILNAAAHGLDDIDPNEILMDVELAIYDGIKTHEIADALVDAATQNIQQDPGYSTLAARLLRHQIYREALGKEANADPAAAHVSGFTRYLYDAASKGLLDESILEKFDLDALSRALDPSRDDLFGYAGLFTLRDRYLVRDHDARHVLETPQFFWMRVAMGVAHIEAAPTEVAVAFYHKMSNLEYIPSTPTLFNATSHFSQLSSCFLMETQDSIADVGKSLQDIMLLAKYAGGIGTSVTRLRATGSHIRSINGKSSGPIPFIKMMDAVISGVDQGGRRRGTLAVYCEPWHYDIEKFLVLKQRAGDDHLRAHTLNTVLWLNDEFLARVERGEDWYLFDPNEVQDLPELYGASFSRRYAEYVERARRGELRLFRVMKARDLFEKMLKNLQETSHPWLTFKDPGNVRCPIKNVGVVHSSNLCTEIFLPTDRENTAVCNLTSVNLARHLAADGEIDWTRLEQSVRLAIRQLDNVIDANFYAIPEAERANKETRPVGLGVMGLADLLEQKGIPYASEQAADLFDRIVEFVSYHAIRTSAGLAKERGSFPAFQGSDWSNGVLPLDTLADLEKERGARIDVNRVTRLDWEALRAEVRAGMRNGTVLAIAPTATISLIANTSPSIEPNFSNLFSRNNLSGKFLEINRNLVNDLKDLDLWEELAEEILVRRGEILDIAAIPPRLKEVYRSAYTMDPRGILEIAARAQKYVDLGISRNMYLATKKLDALSDIYLTAWRKGLKSTYYAFFRTAMFAEASYASDERQVRAEWAPSTAGKDEPTAGAVCDTTNVDCEACQ